jgi:hypothetical protein
VASSFDFPSEDLQRFLAYMQGVQMDDVEVHGFIPGEKAKGYASLLNDAIGRAWRDRGNRPLPPGYDES